MHRVMIVDDEILARVGIKSLIPWEKYGFVVVGEAENGEKALEMARKQQPDIIITDIKMPVLDGIELIKKMKIEGFDTKFIVLSSYNDFEYVREAMKYGAEEYILKLKMEPQGLLDILSSLAQRLDQERQKMKRIQHIEEYYDMSSILLKERFLKDLIHGNIDSVENIEKQIKLLRLNLSSNNLICIALHMENEDIYKKYSEDDIYILNDSVINIIEKILQRYTTGYVCCMSDMNFAIIYSSKDNVYNAHLYKELYSLANTMKNALKKYLNMSVTVGISNIHQGYANIKIAYKEAAGAVRHVFLHPTKHIIWYEEQHKGKQNQDYTPLVDQLIDLEKAFSIGEIEEINKIFDNIKHDLSSCTNVTKESLKGICSALIFIVNSFAPKYHMNLENIWETGNKPFQNIERFGDAVYALEWISSIQHKILQHLYESRDYSNIIVRAKQYIQLHYKEDISLGMVSEHLNLSPNYFSELFKKETEQNFIDYVIRLRVEHAKKLLKQSQYKIYQIAQMVGYENMYYFSRIFKKITGMPPIQYRNKVHHT